MRFRHGSKRPRKCLVIKHSNERIYEFRYHHTGKPNTTPNSASARAARFRRASTLETLLERRPATVETPEAAAHDGHLPEPVR